VWQVPCGIIDGMARLFVALWPPAEATAVLAALPRVDVPGVRWAVPEQWMVKVRPLGHVRDEIGPPLIDALEAELDGAPPVVCTVGPATRRLGGQWLGVPVHGLDDLAATVFEATADLVPVTHPQPFQADIVLARGRVLASLAGTPVSATWTANVLSLVADRSNPNAVRYQDLAHIRLG
jgi:2'-5' RNA ligase